MYEVERFLASQPPFDDLDPEDLRAAADSIQVEFFAAGSVVLRELATPTEHLYVVRTGSVEMVQGGHVVDVLEEGELFGYPSLLSGLSPVMTVRAAEDTLCYLIARQVAEKVFGSPSGLAFLTSSLRRRLERATQIREGRGADPRLVRADSLITRPPLVCEPETPIRQAAELMARERCSSVLVRADGGYGIVTDRDLRSQVVARGVPSNHPVRDVMSFPLWSIPGESLVDDALLEMLDRGIHHLPVVDSSGIPVGVLTDTDVLGLERRRPFVLRTRIERARSDEEVAELGRVLPAATATLVRAGVDPVDIGHIVALIVDTLTRRFLDLAKDDLGPAPGPWAWLALGSEARQEQALNTDQDHALAYADGLDEKDHYYQALAQRVVAGLEACGIPRCRAGVLASEKPWRRTLSAWAGTFEDWMRTRGPGPVSLTTIGFDFRPIAGFLDVETPLDQAVRSARDRPVFLRRLARAALDFRPPLGFRGDLVLLKEGKHAGSLDLKHRGTLPVVDLARLFALEAGVVARGTLQRLAVASEAGVVDDETRQALEEAYRVVLDFRAQHQAAKVEAGLVADNFLNPSSLGRVARASLKDAFRAIAHAQRVVARRYSISRIA
jgi:CBS domain-containing protein